jgi:hypothetical protein
VSPTNKPSGATLPLLRYGRAIQSDESSGKTEGRFVRTVVTSGSRKTKPSGVPIRSVLRPDFLQNRSSILESSMSSNAATKTR